MKTFLLSALLFNIRLRVFKLNFLDSIHCKPAGCPLKKRALIWFRESSLKKLFWSFDRKLYFFLIGHFFQNFMKIIYVRWVDSHYIYVLQKSTHVKTNHHNFTIFWGCWINYQKSVITTVKLYNKKLK